MVDEKGYEIIDKVDSTALREQLKAPPDLVSLRPSPTASDVVYLPPKHFRPGSKARSRVCNFLVAAGGIGDYICYMAAIKWVAENVPQVIGRVYCPPHFLDLATHIMQPHLSSGWKVQDKAQLTEKKFKSRPTFAPSPQPINATSSHPLDLAFIYYSNTTPPPKEANYYPVLDLSNIANEACEAPYAVMTPGATTPNRTMPADTFNGIKEHLLSKGITPLFLGKKQITDVRAIEYQEGYNYEGGVDLREKTTLLQAAGIMSKAKLVVGLDNGLLHLAACTDVPILFGYNIASPLHRRPRRRSQNIWEIMPDPQALPCTFCQSNMRFMFDHDYALCLYKDLACLEALKDPKPWCNIIDAILRKSSPTSPTI